LELIDMLEEPARKHDLLGSFGLLAAAAILTIPYEPMRASHFLHDEDRDPDLVRKLKSLDKGNFLEAPFWRADPDIAAWRQSHIVNAVDDVRCWLDPEEKHPLDERANTIKSRRAGEVIRLLRNALAHGNIIYLDKNGREIAGNRLVYMAFLSRYEKTQEQRRQAETYRVLVTTEEAFLQLGQLGWASGP
jgi:hypothetical protein